MSLMGPVTFRVFGGNFLKVVSWAFLGEEGICLSCVRKMFLFFDITLRDKKCRDCLVASWMNEVKLGGSTVHDKVGVGQLNCLIACLTSGSLEPWDEGLGVRHRKDCKVVSRLSSVNMFCGLGWRYPQESVRPMPWVCFCFVSPTAAQSES